MLRAEADGIVRGEAGLLGDVGDRSPRVVVARRCAAVFSAMHATFALRAGSEIRSCSSTSSGSGGIGCPGQPSISVDPAAWQRTNACGAAPWTSPSVTPEYIGWTSEPWPSTKRSSRRASRPRRRATPPRRRGSRRRPRRRRCPSPAMAIPVCPVGTKTDVEPAPARLEIELDRDRLLADRAVGADREHDRRVDLEVRPRRDAQPRGRLAQVAQLDPALAGELA